MAWPRLAAWRFGPYRGFGPAAPPPPRALASWFHFFFGLLCWRGDSCCRFPPFFLGCLDASFLLALFQLLPCLRCILAFSRALPASLLAGFFCSFCSLLRRRFFPLSFAVSSPSCAFSLVLRPPFLCSSLRSYVFLPSSSVWLSFPPVFLRVHLTFTFMRGCYSRFRCVVVSVWGFCFHLPLALVSFLAPFCPAPFLT